ncbi:ABC transporter substrate-binding protein [Nocardioides yefusunii]|uniref:ABC transporter substrate-binding protein n=1 Tax=Nocardioides yefusunii TaxID=2500546 RepID=A0ABW1R0V8_9ACTN|nr:ABC transporter substrate-binding protein [Nocardioides yefusunii]
MKNTLKRSLAALAVGATLAGALTACGGSDENSGSAADLIKVGTTISLGQIDPMAMQYKTIQHNVFDGLVRVTPTGEVEGRLATEWTRVDDTTVDFTLREGVKFHDGTDVTVEDVVYSFNEPKENATLASTLIMTITGVEAVDEKTVRITTASPDPLLLKSVGQISIVPAKVYEAKGGVEFAKAPIGTGPYKVATIDGDQKVTLEVNDDFWGEKAKTPKVELQYFADGNALATAFESGQVDVAHELPPTALKTLEGNDDFVVKSGYAGNQNMITFNSTKGVFKDEAVREAANKAIDAQGLIEALTYGQGLLEDGQLPIDGIFGYSADIKRPAYDAAAAKAAVKKAGAEGAKIVIAGPSLYKPLLEVVAAQLSEAGFKPVVDSLETSVWLDGLRNGSNADVFYKGVSDMGFFDADRSLSQLARGEKAMVKDAKYSELYAAQRTELDETKREQAIQAVSEYVADKDFVLWTYGRPSVNATIDEVSGLTFDNGLMLLLDDAVKK